MKTIFCKITAIMLIAIMLVPMFAAQALAATSWPSLSSSKYCEFTAAKKINVYRDANCSVRGTSSPAKSYNASISKNDVCRILKITSSYVELQYPTSSGYRTGYIQRSALLGVSAPTATVTFQNKVTSYTSANGKRYGYVAKGDKVYACGQSGQYTAVIYPARSGNRAYKLAYVKTSQYNDAIVSSKQSSSSSSTSTSSSWDSKVGKTVAAIKSGSSYGYYYNSKGNISAAGGYTGECTWYAFGRFYEVNQIALKSAPHAKKWLSRNEGDSRVKVVYGASQIASKSIAVRTSGTYGHVMFIEHVTFNKDGSPAYVYFTECNSDGNSTYNAGKDCVLQRLTYADFVRKKNPAGYIIKK